MADDLLLPAQVRAARALLDWSQDDLARRAGVGLSTVKDMEIGKRDPSSDSVAAIRRALEVEGVRFLPSNGEGPGARLHKPHIQVIRWPTRKTIDDLFPFRVAWRNTRVNVYLPALILDDLAGVATRPTEAEYIEIFRHHLSNILARVSNAIEGGRIGVDGWLRMTSADFFGSGHHGR